MVVFLMINIKKKVEKFLTGKENFAKIKRDLFINRDCLFDFWQPRPE